MKDQEGLLDSKRTQLRVQIRRNQLQDYFQKRRHDLLSNYQDQYQTFSEDEEKSKIIMIRISEYNFSNLVHLLRKIAALESDLALFYRLTGFNPASPPAYFHNILSSVLGFPVSEIEMMGQQKGYIKQYNQSEKQLLRQIWIEFESLWREQQARYAYILSLLKRVNDMNYLVHEEIISFLSVILNILLMFRNISDIVGIELTKKMLVGSEQFLNYEIQTTINILFNILSAEDEQKLAPMVQNILEVNGHNCQLLPLFYNMFLIKGVTTEVRLKILQYFVNVIQYQTDFLLNNYHQIYYTLYTAIKTKPDLKNEKEKKIYIDIGQKIVQTTARLLTVLNMRFDSTYTSFESKIDQQQDNHYLIHLTSILKDLSHQTILIRALMQQRSMLLFILHRIFQPKTDTDVKVLSNCLNILIYASKDHHSAHYFLNQQPRILVKINLLFDKYLNANLRKMNYEECYVVQSLIVLLKDLSFIDKIAQMFINQSLISKVANMYFHLISVNFKNKNVKQSCEILFLKLLKYLRFNASDISQFYQFLFIKDNQIIFLALINFLKYGKNRKIILTQALDLINFITYNSPEITFFEVIRDTLMQQILSANLSELQNCEDDEICRIASYIIKLIQEIKKIKNGSNDYENDYQDL